MTVFEKICAAAFVTATLCVICLAMALTDVHGSWTVTVQFGQQPNSPLAFALSGAALSEPPDFEAPAKPKHKPIHLAQR